MRRVILQAAANAQGVSLMTVKKMLENAGYDVRKNKPRIRAVLRYFFSKSILVRLSGRGLSGSFRLCKTRGVQAAAKKKSGAKSRQSGANKGTAAAKPRERRVEIKPAAVRRRGVARSRGKIKGTVAMRRRQIVEEIIRGSFLMER